nr:conotoxin precursor O1 [Conus ebraeus]
MKLTCMMIVAVLFLTAWTFVTAEDSNNGLANLFSKAREELKNPTDDILNNNKRCVGENEPCIIPLLGTIICCTGVCLIVCVG